MQTSLYGASKLAGEGLISAYCEGFGFRRGSSVSSPSWANGTPTAMCSTSTRSCSRTLRSWPCWATAGNGSLTSIFKTASSAIFTALERAQDKVNVFNLGTDEYCEVNDSIGWITEALGLSPRRVYSGGDRGWIGDNPFIFLDTTKIRALGWKPELTIHEGILRTLSYLKANSWVLERRA